MTSWISDLSDDDLESKLDTSVRKLLEVVGRAPEDVDNIAFALTSLLRHFGSKQERQLAVGFWPKVKKEMYTLICKDDYKYAELRQELSKGSTTARDTVVAVIAGAVSRELGFGAALLTPFVVLCLIALLRVGKEAWCRFFCQSENAEGR